MSLLELNGKILPAGMIMPVKLSLHTQTLLSGNDRDKSLDRLALIDTGAIKSHIKLADAQSLKLQKIGEDSTYTLSHEVKVEIFLVKITIGQCSFDIEADSTNGSLTDAPFDMIIGRDILQFLTLTYNGPENTFSLKIPN